MLQAETAQGDLSSERQELRYLLQPERAQFLAQAMAGRLQHHRFRGSGIPLPRPRHFITTVYFDTPGRHHFRALHAASNSGAVQMKLRAREYYDLHPSLAELATQPSHLVRHHPGLWLELKFREGNRTGKRRIGLPKRSLLELLAHPERVPSPHANALRGEEAILAEIRAFCLRFPGPIRADSLVHYRRLPWQDPDGALRVTLDVGVEFFAPPQDLWQDGQALTRAVLGPPKGKLERAIIELKYRVAPPPWLIHLLEQVGAEPSRVSKFEEATRAVHGVHD